jgi:hypothetical protein
MNHKAVSFNISLTALPAMLAVFAVLVVPASAQVKLEQLSKDTFKNSSTQHATEVEPDTYSFGSTFVTAFQVGRRYANGGSSDLGFATSTDGGSTWKNGFLPGLTVFYKSGTYNTVSDASVVYDAAHKAWLVASLGIDDAEDTTTLLVSNSSDGIDWNNPVVANNNSSYADKDWITCDNTSTSKYYGHCYIEWEDAGIGDQVMMTTSTDGGKTWSAKYAVPNAIGLGGQPVVQTDGKVVVPFYAFESGSISTYSSSNGGKSWSSASVVFTLSDHQIAGDIRAVYDFPSVEVGSDGTIYMVWWDCRFRSGCPSNDIVLSSSTDGKTWSSPSRIPIDPVSSTVDHFLAGIAVDQQTSGASTHLGVTYYFYPNANCSVSTCRLGVGFISSKDAGKTWTSSQKLASGMQMSWLPNTTLGYMVGDYISASYLNGKAYGVFAKALAPVGSKFRDAMYTPEDGLYEIEEGNGPYVSSAGEMPVPNAKSDHPPVPYWDSDGTRPRVEKENPRDDR